MLVQHINPLFRTRTRCPDMPSPHTMRPTRALVSGLMAASNVAAALQHGASQQTLLDVSAKQPARPAGVGHFSEWSRQTKKEFLIDWQAGKESEWILVQGNEGGDLDSMTAALTWAYHLEHSTMNSSNPVKAIALLQTPSHALDLRPENKLALDNSQMTPGHEDLLTLDELPEDPETLSKKLKGIILVDHAASLRKWSQAQILTIIDHHKDRGTAPDADPRIFETAASCTTLVARQMLDELERLEQEYHMPHELLELILSAIAIDSGGLTSDKTTKADVETSKRVLARSNWRDNELDQIMEDLDHKLTKAQKNIDKLGLYDLLRRDWKSDVIDTPSPHTPTITVGFASIPYSMDEQILKTEFRELFDWFAIHAAWTAHANVDVSVSVNKFKKHYKDGTKEKIREVVLVVRDDVRIDQNQADSLFALVKDAIEKNSLGIDFQPWHRADQLAPRQMVWQHRSDAGRKVIKPLVEDAITGWD